MITQRRVLIDSLEMSEIYIMMRIFGFSGNQNMEILAVWGIQCPVFLRCIMSLSDSSGLFINPFSIASVF